MKAREQTEEQAIQTAEELIDNMNSLDRQEMRKAATRHDRARIASNIAQDRYSAGSTAARCTIAILLRDGVEAAIDFANDLEHHES